MFRFLAALVIAAALPATVLAQALPDPTERTTAAQRTTQQTNPRWTLESTLIAQDRRVAVINGETVIVGDRVLGARILSIETHGVRLRTAGGVIELTLSGDDPKQFAGGAR